MARLDDLPRIEVKSRAEWRKWLIKNHKTSGSIWLVAYKKALPEWHVPAAQIAEEALCFGWVDSLPRKLDEERSMLLLAPRKPKSAWSKINKERAERMMAQGLMQASGLAVIEAAKASGTWTKLDEIETLAVPPDLTAAFAKNKKAASYFEAFPRSVKRGILEWIIQAKKPETRAKRVAETVELAAQNIRANQWRQ
jgi:uncharacterized protein YdeI (YjbR/CyaY-like superfamily)